MGDTNEITENTEGQLSDDVIFTLVSYITNGTMADRIKWGRKYGPYYTTYGTKIPLWDEVSNFYLKVKEVPVGSNEKPEVKALIGDHITITETVLLSLLYPEILKSMEREKVAASKAEVERLTRLALYINKIPDEVNH